MSSSSSSQEEVNICEWIANAISDTGVRTVFGGHGGALVPMVNAICAHPKLTWVCARNEHDAATMAAAYAKMTGGLGVVIATSGPGATNLVTGLMEAVLDQVPLLALTGLKPSQVIGYSEFQDVNQSRLFSGGGIEWSKDAASAHAVIPLLRDAVATALSQRTCAHLAIPVDIQAAPSPLPPKHFCASHATIGIKNRSVDATEIRKVAETLAGKPEERPPRNVLAVGLRAIDSSTGNVSEAILDLAEALNAPVLTRLDAKGAVDETHPLAFGIVGVHGKPGLEQAAALISTSDRVISIGVSDETILLCNSAGLQIRRLIEIQPDAFAVSTRFEAEHTLMGGDITDILASLTSTVEGLMVRVDKKRRILTAKKPAHMKHNSQIDQISYMCYNNPRIEHRRSTTSDFKELFLPALEELGMDEFEKRADKLWAAMHEGNWRSLATLDKYARYQNQTSKPGTCHPGQVLENLSKLRVDPSTDAVSRDATVAVDVGDVTLWASLCLILKGGSRTLYSERLGTMGYALNAGIAAILSHPGPSGAVVLAGDGGFQMSLQELATFQQMKRPGDKLLCIVFDNSLLGRVAFGFENSKGCEMVGPDYVALSKAYGGEGARLDDPSKTTEILKQALATEGLYMIHVILDPEVKADMATFKDKALAVMSSG